MNPYETYMLGALCGDEFDDDAELGAAAQMLPMRTMRRLTTSVPARRSAAVRAIAQQIKPGRYPGTPPRGPREWPLGFGSFTFVNAGATTAQLNASPQRVFQGQRLVVDIARSAGATAELVTITDLQVGSQNQLVSATALPANAFAPGSFHTVLDLDPSEPGIVITLGLAISAAPGVGETVSVSAMLIGTSLG